ncbi:MAG: 50S ribosomal protein L21e [Nanoarchaeota archaeon]|nr:50S ribosomal protein L21e [Nanoarchaeota archaeon]
MQHHHSFKRGTRSKLSKSFKDKGKISIRKFFQEFQKGDRVTMQVEPSYGKGMYYPRFHGRTGLVLDQRGKCYGVLVKDGGKEKLLVVHPIHLTRSN